MEEVIQKTAEYVKKCLEDEGTGHDWWHIHRVWKMAFDMGSKEGGDLFIIQLAALLHDIGDWKFYDGDESIGPRKARVWLKQLGVAEEIIEHVCEIIKDLSFKGAGVPSTMRTKEGMIVQDADRLDALGAIGIARTFAYNGSKGRVLYNPQIKPEQHLSFEQYKKNKGPAINHFYEKLLLLKDLMNTSSAKRIAEQRHLYMEQFLDRFLKEWEGSA